MQEAAARSLRRGLERLRPLVKNKTLRYGVPMMLLIIGGSFGLREFTQIRYDAQKLHSKMDPALEERIRKNKITLESEYEIFCLRKEDNVEVNGQVLSALLLELVNSLNQKQYKNGLLSLLISCRKLKSSDFDDWKNVRGPRPWEDSKSLQEQQQQVLHAKPS